MEPLSDQVRSRVQEANDKHLSRYRIAQLTGIDQAALSRFMNGGGISTESLDKLGRVLGLKVTSSPEAIRQAIAKAKPKSRRAK